MSKIFAILCLLLAVHAPLARGAFELRDFLGREWRNELVRFPLSAQDLQDAKAQRPLVTGADKPVLYQVVAGDAPGTSSIAFLADLDPFERKSYRFAGAPRAAPATDLRVEDAADSIVIANALIGIEIRKHTAPAQGPVASVRLASKMRVGDSLLRTAQPIKSYSTYIAARGPVLAEVVVKIEFAQRGRWEIRFRMNAHEPVVLVDEAFSDADGASYSFVLNRGFAPTNLLYRYGSGDVGRLVSQDLASAGANPVFVLEPWLHWWERERQGTWFALYNGTEPTLLAIGARDAQVWVEPTPKPDSQKTPHLPVTKDGDTLALTLPLATGARRWMIAAVPREASLSALKGSNPHVAPLPQQYIIKYSAFPLNVVKDYVLSWEGDETDHPRLIVTRRDLARIRALAPVPTEQRPRTGIANQSLDATLADYLRTEDPALGKPLSAAAAQALQNAVDMYLKQDRLVSFGFGPHHQSDLFAAVNMADVVWSSEHVSPELRQRMKAQLAFLAYTVNRPDYWSPARGFSANPNMTTTVAGFQVMLGSMIPAHPLSRQWTATGVGELKRQLDGWSDPDGGWAEAPHYALVAYDCLLAAFTAAYNAGANEYLYDPRMKKVAEWLAKISTPPDSASLDHRHLPPIGNTWMREPSGIFGTVAALWRERDPVFAAEMQWMYRQQGSPSAPGVGGFFAPLAGFRSILLDPALVPKAPAYRSELFGRTGAMLRSHFPSSRETQMHVIAGTNHAHYDRDSGSFTLWGKGRIVAQEFGYYGEAPGEEHSMVISARAPAAATFNVSRLVTGDDVDYLAGGKNDGWQRRIVFVKDADPLGPNYFVVSDTVADRATWRTWFDAGSVTPSGQSARVEGREDVDTDIFVAAAGSAPSTQTLTRETWGVTAGKYGRVSTTLTALTVPFGPGALVTVLYPRLKTERNAVFTPIAGGKGIRIGTPAGTDYVFVSDTPISYREGTIAFDGTVGAALIRRGKPKLWLGGPGAIAAQGAVLKQPSAEGPGAH